MFAVLTSFSCHDGHLASKNLSSVACKCFREKFGKCYIICCGHTNLLVKMWTESAGLTLTVHCACINMLSFQNFVTKCIENIKM